MASSSPSVFIIESLRFHDEERERFEGRFLSQILHLGGSAARYVYLRTKKELGDVLDQFAKSRYRYLHFSCHGNETGIELTLDDLSFRDLRKLLAPHLAKRRVFFSSCEVTNRRLAKALLSDSDCYSVIGPCTKINFDRAAIFWASFYHLMLRDEATSMKRSTLTEITGSLQSLFGVHMRYFTASGSAPDGFKEVDLAANHAVQRAGARVARPSP